MAVNEQTDRVELPSSYEWSWPAHPTGMGNAEARMRYPRLLREYPTAETPIKDADLASAYGRLLTDGKARIQENRETGDNLPRDTGGHLLEIRQQMAAEIAEVRNGLEPGVYATQPLDATREPGPVPNHYGALDGRRLATWLPSEDRPETAIKTIRHNDAAQTSLAASKIARLRRQGS